MDSFLCVPTGCEVWHSAASRVDLRLDWCRCLSAVAVTVAGTSAVRHVLAPRLQAIAGIVRAWSSPMER
jgi:hypothetical protein